MHIYVHLWLLYVSIAKNRSIKELTFVSSLPPLIEGEQRGVTDGFGLAYTLMSDWLGNNSVEKVMLPWCDGESVSKIIVGKIVS